MARFFSVAPRFSPGPILGLLLGLTFGGLPLRADWPNQRGNAPATGSADGEVKATLAESWKVTLEDGIEATPVIANGRVYVGDFQGNFVCLSLQDGREIWKTKIPAARAAAAVLGGSVVVGDLDGTVHALSAEDGSKRWSFDLGGVIDSGPTLLEDRVLIASQSGELVSLKLSDGTEMWRYPTSDQLRCSPTVAGGRVFLGGCDGRLHQVDVETGKPIGEPVSLDGPTGATPAVMNDLAIVPTMGGYVFGINWRESKKTWEYTNEEREQEYRSSAAVTERIAVVCGQAKLVTAIDMTNGKPLWTETLRRRADASPVIAGKSVFVAATDGQLLRYELETGKLLWKHEIRGSYLAAPAISDGALVAVTDKGDVICFR